MLMHIDYCLTCKMDTTHFNNKCSVCSNKEHVEKENTWNALPIEKKVEILKKRLDEFESNIIDRIIN